MTAERAEVAVVGLGLIGSGALRSLADAGARVVGWGTPEPADRTTHEGPFASHHDAGRITRRLDATLDWAVLADRAIAGYAELERRSGITFHRPAGLVLAELADDRIAAVRGVGRALDVPVDEHPPGSDAAHPLLALPPRSHAFVEPAPAGHIDPRRMRRANVAVAVAAGATVSETTVVSIEPDGDGWRLVDVDGRSVTAERVVVTTGPHSDELGLPRRPSFAVRGETILMAHLGEAEAARLATLPSVLAALDHPIYEDLYQVPPTVYPDGSIRLKLGATLRSPRRLDDAGSRRTWMRGDEHRSEAPALRELMTALVPGLVAERWETAACLITDTGSGLPVVDHVAPGLVVAAGGNGYAAKSANAIGDLAARLALSGSWPDDQLEAARFTGRG